MADRIPPSRPLIEAALKQAGLIGEPEHQPEGYSWADVPALRHQAIYAPDYAYREAAQKILKGLGASLIEDDPAPRPARKSVTKSARTGTVHAISDPKRAKVLRKAWKGRAS